MNLRRLQIEGFGALTGTWTFEPERIHLIVGGNERGKTTLAAAIVAALYGLDSDRRAYRERETPLDQHRPWSGRTYALELEFEIEGRRYIVSRHFGNGRLNVHEDGRDVTDSFRHGSGEYKLGEELLGMNIDQFARTALWMQPGPGRLGGADVRPDGSLTAMLESMASSVTGDASAVAAFGVLDNALRSYRGMQQSGLVTNEIKKLEIALATNKVDLASAENERRELADALERLTELGLREARLTAALTRVRREETRRRIGDLAAVLERDAAERRELESHRTEVKGLEGSRDFPADAASRLARAKAENESALSTLEQIAKERERDLAAPRLELETLLAKHGAFEWAAPGHIEELHMLEKDLERVTRQERESADKLGALESELVARGLSLAYLAERAGRFGGLSGEDRTLLTQYPAQTQAIVVETENAQRAITGGQGQIEAIARQRGRQRGWGITFIGVGLVACAAAVWFALHGQVIQSFVGLGGTLLGLSLGTVFLFRSAVHRNNARNEALKQVLDAQRRLGELQHRRKAREDLLAGLSGRLGFPDVTALLREHGEFLRVSSENQRAGWLEEDATRARSGRAEALEHVVRLARRAGLPESIPAHEALAKLRLGIGTVLDARARAKSLEAVEARLVDQERVAGLRRDDARADLVAIAKRLGLASAEVNEAEVIEAVERRAREHARLETLERELIPRAEERLLSEGAQRAQTAELERLRAELAAAEDPASASRAAAPAPVPAEGDRDAASIERELSVVRSEQIDLHARVGGRDRDSAERLARFLADRTRLSAALVRARQFKDAVELARERFQTVARETNARWSEHLAGRAESFLVRFGLPHQGFRISDQLEVSLSMGGERLSGSRLDAALSAGARDQVELALRLAICEYLARGRERLPLLFDDPFATSDDERAAHFLKALGEVTRSGHQVLVLTCHRALVENLRSGAPGWFEEAVRVLDLAPGVATQSS